MVSRVIVLTISLLLILSCATTSKLCPEEDIIIFTERGMIPVLIKKGSMDDCSKYYTPEEYEKLREEYNRKLLEEYMKRRGSVL